MLVSQVMAQVLINWTLLITAQATSAELELSMHLLWLTQETSEKNTPNVLL